MLKTRSKGSHVDALERRLECVDDKSIGSITNCMDVLETVHEFWEGKGCNNSYSLPAISQEFLDVSRQNLLIDSHEAS